MSEDKKNQANIDSDADGLSDTEEKELGTNPYDPDTDHDDLGDYQEVKLFHTDPLNPDTDGDNLSDGQEVKIGRNPCGTGRISDLFIPNQCNDYRPKALRPKRLAFHAGAAISIKLLMVFFVLSFPVQAWLSPDILYEQSRKIIELTNNIRSGLSLNILQENPKLSEAALNKAQDMIVNEYFAHIGPNNRSLRNWLYNSGYNFSVAGENLALGFTTADDVVDAWVASKTHYANIIDPDFTEIGVGAVSGEYKGYETTLVAQYFGSPIAAATSETPVTKPITVLPPDYDAKIKPPEEVTGAPIETPSTSPDLIKEPILEQPSETSEVLADQAEQLPLLKPTLLSPKDGSISNTNLNIFQISAPQAEKILVFDNNKELVSKVVTNINVDISVNLAEGRHNIVIYSIRGKEKIASAVYTFIIDQTAPIIDQSKTTILVNQPSGQDDLVVKATAYISPDTKEANISFAEYSLALARDYSEDNKWSGHLIITDKSYDDVFSPVVLASLTTVDEAGNKLTQDISWQDIRPVKNSIIGQYMFLKNNPSPSIQPIFDFTATYYKIILMVAVLALLLNVFIEVRKQHYPTIASTLGLIFLMAILTIF